MTEAQHAGSANAVFVGALVDSRVDPSVLSRTYRQARLKERNARSIFRNLDPVVLTFEVSRVYKGVVGKRQEIIIPPAATRGGTCGFYVPAGLGPWLVFTYQSPDDDTYQLDPGQYLSAFSTVCSGGSRALADGGEPALGGPPAGGLDGWTSPASLVVGVGVLAAGVAAGLGLATLRTRRRASSD